MWRKALNKLKLGKPATYPKLDKFGDLFFYVLAPSKEQMVALCTSYIKCPCAWIRVKHRCKGRPKRFFYVRLIDRYAVSWLKHLKRSDNGWKLVKKNGVKK